MKSVPARAEIISGQSVKFYAAEVKEPVAVRYAWDDFPLCNLYGGYGFPAVPFRADSFVNA